MGAALRNHFCVFDMMIGVDGIFKVERKVLEQRHLHTASACMQVSLAHAVEDDAATLEMLKLPAVFRRLKNTALAFQVYRTCQL